MKGMKSIKGRYSINRDRNKKMFSYKKLRIDRSILRRDDEPGNDERPQNKFSAKFKHLKLSCRGTRNLFRNDEQSYFQYKSATQQRCNEIQKLITTKKIFIALIVSMILSAC